MRRGFFAPAQVSVRHDENCATQPQQRSGDMPPMQAPLAAIILDQGREQDDQERPEIVDEVRLDCGC